MSDFEAKVMRWRANLPATLRNDLATVMELEEHIREDTARLCREGMHVEAAFETAANRLGDPNKIAHEFDRIGSHRAPRTGLVLAGSLLTLITVLGMNTFLTWAYLRGKIAPLLFVHVVVIGTGYLVVLGLGLLGLLALLTPIWRPLRATEQRELRGTMLWLSVVASVLVPTGAVFGMFWAAHDLGRVWSWQPVEIGTLLVLASSWLLLLAQTRIEVRDDTRAWLALLGGIASVVGFAARAQAPAVLVGWLCVAVLFGQTMVFLFQRSVHRESGT